MHSLADLSTPQRVKGMPGRSASLIRNRHLTSIASEIGAFHPNEETEATVSALLCELRDENAKLAAGVDRACATAMDKTASDVLRATTSSTCSVKLMSPSLAISELWMSRKDTSVHWVLTRLRRLQAMVQSSHAHLDCVEKEIPAAAAAFRSELKALSSIGLSATITSACLDGYLDKYRGVADRIASLRKVLGWNIDHFDRFCVTIGKGLDSFDIASLDGLRAVPSGIPVDAVLAALVQHVDGIVLQYISDRDAVIEDLMGGLLDVGDAEYRSRLEARASGALASGVTSVVGRIACELFSRDALPSVRTALSDRSHDKGNEDARFAVVLAAPTVREAALVACRLLSKTAAEINRLVSDAIGGLAPVDIAAIEAIGNLSDESGLGRLVRVSGWLVVEVEDFDEAGAQVGTQPRSHLPSLAADSTTSRLPTGLDQRIESVVNEAAFLKEAILGHLRSTKEELAPHVPTVVSDLQERSWLLDAAIDRLRYDCDASKCLHGDDRVLPEKGAHDGLIQSLRSKVLKTEQALFDDFHEMETRVRDIQSDLEWMKGIQSYSMIDLEVKLREVGVTLDQCVDRARVGFR